ncbi:hypothetical protein [Paenibacillus sp. PAMC21692]
MGINNAREMKIISEITKTGIGVITIIGVSHLSSLGSRKEIALAKLENKT